MLLDKATLNLSEIADQIIDLILIKFTLLVLAVDRFGEFGWHYRYIECGIKVISIHWLWNFRLISVTILG